MLEAFSQCHGRQSFGHLYCYLCFARRYLLSPESLAFDQNTELDFACCHFPKVALINPLCVIVRPSDLYPRQFTETRSFYVHLRSWQSDFDCFCAFRRSRSLIPCEADRSFQVKPIT